MKVDIAVVGGGASGMCAAIFAARCGALVAVLEKNQRIGKKILSTGNGRCNFTNINTTHKNYNSDFVLEGINKFSPDDVMTFFGGIGLLSTVEDEGRVYPLSGQGSAVLDVLRLEIERLKIAVKTEFDVDCLNRTDDGFEIVSKTGDRCISKAVIVSTGGCAAPKSGSDGSGYKLLKKLGHTVTHLKPALVQIKTDRGIQGVRAPGRVTLSSGRSAEGEIQFNNYGISGIPVFSLAKYINVGENVVIDLMSEYTHEEAFNILKNRPLQSMETYLIGILNKNLGHMILKECNISPLSRMSDTLTDKEISRIVKTIKCWTFEVTGIMPWDNAQVTSGGMSLSEVDPKTMESKIVNNLYITGELLDIDGDCGGYNLQWAWSSGALAGGAAACSLGLTT